MAHLNTDNIDQALALKAPVKYADINNFLFINSNKVLYLFGDKLLASYELVIETCRTFCSYLNRFTGVKQDSNLKDGHRQMRSTERLLEWVANHITDACLCYSSKKHIEHE